MRKPVVSRTVKITEAVAMVVNKETGKVTDRKYTVARALSDKKALLKAVEKLEADSDIKVVTIKASQVSSHKYSMTVDEFIEKAKQIS